MNETEQRPSYMCELDHLMLQQIDDFKETLNSLQLTAFCGKKDPLYFKKVQSILIDTEIKLCEVMRTIKGDEKNWVPWE